MAFFRRTSTADFSSVLQIFAVPSVIPPPQTLGRPSTARSTETENEESLLKTPLFWIAVMVWFLVVLPLIVVVILAK
jgi:hypothetical protein